MEECESLESEMTDLQEFQCEASETISQDDEDEVEELHNSLREVVQDPSVKPKLQCLLIDPSFSMVTVQSEDSGIIWETASSRCSTPWASETSSISEAYSMEGSGAAGKITIVFDEEKIIRRRVRSGGRSRLGDRLSRPGSSRSASALGVERLEMAEVSVPNVKVEKTGTEPDLTQIKNKDQQLFSLVSEGYEILNIRVPSKLPTVDEEESTELQDKLSYLDQTPMIKSRNHHDWTLQQNHVLPEEREKQDHQESSEQDSSTPSADTELRHTPTQKDNNGDIDYFEKFTLVDVVGSGKQGPELQEETEQPAAKPKEEGLKPSKEASTDSLSASEDSFVFVTEVEIVEEHLDEVFYGEGAPTNALQRRGDDQAEDGVGRRMRRGSKRNVKESGSVLFESEETILTPIFISPGPPKIIDPILLEEPTAMSFMYSDLYEDAVGERRKSDEEYSEAESVVSEKSYKRRFSDSEEADGYLEKFTLKDETPTVEVHSESVEDQSEGRMMWPQSKFEMTGCRIRMVKEEDGKTKIEEPETQETSVEDRDEDLKSVAFEAKGETGKDIEYEREEMKEPMVTEEQTVREAAEESIQESELKEDVMGDRQVKHEINGDETEPLESSADGTLPLQVDSSEDKTENQTEELEETFIITEPVQLCATQEVSEKTAGADLNAAEETAVIATLSREEPHITGKSEIPKETNDKSLSEEAAPDDEVVFADEKVITEVMVENPAEIAAETSLCDKTAAAEAVPEDVAPVEVFTDCDSTVHAVVEIFDKAVNENEMQTQVQIDFQEVPSVEKADAYTEAPEEEHEVPAQETAVESQLPEFLTEADQESEVKTEISRKETEPVMPEVVKTASEEKQVEILESKQHQQEDSANDSEKTTLTPEAKDETSTEDTVTNVCDKMIVGEELILFVPKGQAVEMDIEVSQWSEKTADTLAFSGPDSTCECLVASETTTTTCPETFLKQNEESVAVPQEEVQPEAVQEKEALPRVELDNKYSPSPSTLMEEAHAEDEKVERSGGLMSFTPQEDLSEQHNEDMQPEAEDSEQRAETHKVENASPEPDLHRQVVGEKIEQHEAVVEDPGVLVEELEYEVITEQDAKEMPEPEVQKDAEESKHESDQEKEDRMEIEMKMEEETLIRDELDDMYPPFPSTPMEEANTDDEKVGWDLNKNEGIFSRLRSFTPQEDLSGQHKEDMQPEAADLEQKAETYKVEDASPEPDLHREDVGQKMEQHEAVREAPEVLVEEPGYEVISEQPAKEMLDLKSQEDAEEPEPESGQEKEERMEMEMKMQEEEKAFDLSPEEELIEDDYDIIDAEEVRQARLAAELEGLNWFCLTCGCLLSEEICESGEHHSHEVTAVDKAYEEMKEKLSDWISELQERSENIEDLVSELELAYNSIEDQCVESEAAMQAQNEEMMALVMEQYNNMSISLEEEKKAKLEQLYDQIVSFQESIDSTKSTLETTAREAETDARSPEDIHSRLKDALDSVMSLELGPQGLLVFEDYAKGNTSSSHLTQRKGIPVPQRPALQPQEPGSATSTSVTVYWKVSPEDVIDCFQVYCMEDPQGAVSEEYRVTVKESYCVLEELEPDKTFKVWVMAVNYTGCSLPSERLTFRTAPSVPAIDTERCTVMGDTATLRWSATKKTSEQSYALEYCRQYELEGEGLRSIAGIEGCEQNVLLQHDENYLFYIKAVNEAGASEQSEAALISTKGTRFHLLRDSAHPALELSVDQTALRYSQDASGDTPSADEQCPSILGELLLARGHHYWETVVSGSTAYRLGVAYRTANRNSPLGENKLSWCLQCIPTTLGCRYQLLHNDTQSSLLVTEVPGRVGTLLDYQRGRLSFYNAQSGQLLGTFCQRFTQPCHPALALDLPGSLEVRMVPEVPEFAKDR